MLPNEMYFKYKVKCRKTKNHYYVKSVRIRSCSGPHFPAMVCRETDQSINKIFNLHKLSFKSPKHMAFVQYYLKGCVKMLHLHSKIRKSLLVMGELQVLILICQ